MAKRRRKTRNKARQKTRTKVDSLTKEDQQLLETAIDLVFSTTSGKFLDVESLQASRATCRSFKSSVDKELDRRIVEDILPSLPLELRQHGGNALDSDLTQELFLSVGWCKEFCTLDGRVESALEYAQHPERLDAVQDHIEGGTLPQLDKQGAEEKLREEGHKLNIQKFLIKSNDDSDDDEEPDYWDENLEWTVEIDMERSETRQGLCQEVNKLFSEAGSSGMEDVLDACDEPVDEEYLNEYVKGCIWILLLRADSSAVVPCIYEERDFTHQRECTIEGCVNTIYMFKTMGREILLRTCQAAAGCF